MRNQNNQREALLVDQNGVSYQNWPAHSISTNTAYLEASLLAFETADTLGNVHNLQA
jgi:hypothetical protein